MPKKGINESELPRTGRLSRGAIAGMAVARAGLAHLGHKAQSLTRDSAQQAQARTAHEAELGRILFAALNQLKGTALKASQLMSMELGFLPEGMRQELALRCWLCWSSLRKTWASSLQTTPKPMPCC